MARAFSGIWDRTIDITDMSRVLYRLSYSAVDFHISKKTNFCQVPNEFFSKHLSFESSHICCDFSLR